MVDKVATGAVLAGFFAPLDFVLDFGGDTGFGDEFTVLNDT